MTDVLVAGEDAQTLVEALLRFRWSDAADGGQSATFELEPHLGAPLIRAVMRVEAELLLDDADHYPHGADAERTSEQRAADALVALALRVTDALLPSS